MIGFLNTSEMVAAAKYILRSLEWGGVTVIDLVGPNTIKKLFFPHRAHKAAANLSKFKSEMGDEAREAAVQSAVKPLTLKAPLCGFLSLIIDAESYRMMKWSPWLMQGSISDP